MAKTFKPCSVEGCNAKRKARGVCMAHYHRLMKYGDPLGIGQIMPPAGEPLRWLRSHVAHVSDGCLIWPFAKNEQGRGNLWIGKRSVRAHRLMCILAHGEPPTPRSEAAHSCGNGHLGCVNPRHLRWATRGENMLDRISHGTSNRGEAHGLATLTEDTVRSIRAMLGTTTQRRIAEQLGISYSTVSDIKLGKRWGWLA